MKRWRTCFCFWFLLVFMSILANNTFIIELIPTRGRLFPEKCGYINSSSIWFNTYLSYAANCRISFVRKSAPFRYPRASERIVSYLTPLWSSSQQDPVDDVFVSKCVLPSIFLCNIHSLTIACALYKTRGTKGKQAIKKWVSLIYTDCIDWPSQYVCFLSLTFLTTIFSRFAKDLKEADDEIDQADRYLPFLTLIDVFFTNLSKNGEPVVYLEDLDGIPK